MNLPDYIEIETSRYCNRQCRWCPNGTTATRQTQQLMPWELFEQIIQELKCRNYRGWLALHNFNEPLANPRLTAELSLIRDQVPACKPSIFSNGDFLDKRWVRTLADLRVAYLRITLYPPSLHTKTISGDEPRLDRWLRDRDLLEMCNWEQGRARQGSAAVGMIPPMTVEVIAPDTSRYNWRGGTVPWPSETDRREPCHMSSHSASIDYQGRLKMCCNVYPEASAHAAYLIGSLNEQSFEALWSSSQMDFFRKAHLAADWSLSPICVRCNQKLPVDAPDAASLTFEAPKRRQPSD